MTVKEGNTPAVIELQNLNIHNKDEQKASAMTERAQELIDELFTYKPWTKAQQESGEEIVEACKALALAVVVHLPATPGRSRVLNQIASVRMEANAVITHGGDY